MKFFCGNLHSPREHITMHLIRWWIHGANPVMEFQKWVFTVCKPVNHRTVAAGGWLLPTEMSLPIDNHFSRRDKAVFAENVLSNDEMGENWEKIQCELPNKHFGRLLLLSHRCWFCCWHFYIVSIDFITGGPRVYRRDFFFVHVWNQVCQSQQPTGTGADIEALMRVYVCV